MNEITQQQIEDALQALRLVESDLLEECPPDNCDAETETWMSITLARRMPHYLGVLSCVCSVLQSSLDAAETE